MDEEFDFAAWRSQGEQMLDVMVGRESKLKAQLKEVQAEVKRLQSALGKGQKSTRKRIRPVLRRKLVEESPANLEQLIREVAEEVGTELSSVESSLSRWVTASPDEVSIREDQVILH